MKWIFLLLLVVNIAIFLWGGWYDAHQDTVRPQIEAGKGNLRLLSRPGKPFRRPIPPPFPDPSDETAGPPVEAVTGGEGTSPATGKVEVPTSLAQAGREAVPVPPDNLASGEAAAPARNPGPRPVAGEATAEPALEPATREAENMAPAKNRAAGAGEGGGAPSAQEATGGSQVPGETESGGSGAQPGMPGQEGAVAPVPPVSPSSSAPPSPPESVVPAARMCGTLGPLDDQQAATSLLDALVKAGVDAVMRTEEEEKTTGYWVIIPPLPIGQQAVAVVERLKRKGVKDTGRFYRGKYRNGVSLGIFSRRENAEKRRQQIAAKGFQPRVVPRLRVFTRYSIEFRTAGEAAETVSRVLQDYPGVEIRPGDCAPGTQGGGAGQGQSIRLRGPLQNDADDRR